jgi:hypothetical protein
MSQNSTVTQEMPAILAELWRLLEGARTLHGQERVYLRSVAMVIAELLTLGRHTLTQLIRTLGAVNHDWSAWYRLFEKQTYHPAHADCSQPQAV